MSEWARGLARDAEVFLATTLDRVGLKPPKMYRRRVHVRKALAAAKKAKEEGEKAFDVCSTISVPYYER